MEGLLAFRRHHLTRGSGKALVEKLYYARGPSAASWPRSFTKAGCDPFPMAIGSGKTAAKWPALQAKPGRIASLRLDETS